MNIGVLFGGKSVEHEISILSAYQLLPGLKKYNVFLIYITKNLEMFLISNHATIKNYRHLNDIKKWGRPIHFTKKGIVTNRFIKIDIGLILMHGTYGEDGTMAHFLDMYDIPYVGSSGYGAIIAQDKCFMKDWLVNNNIKTVEYSSYCEDDYFDSSKQQYPLIIKPSCLGSSIGIQIVHDSCAFDSAINRAFSYGKKVLVEKYLPKLIEVNCAVIGDNGHLLVSNVEVVSHREELLTYTEKYAQKKERNIDVLSNDLAEEIKLIALKIYQELEFSGVIRIDFLLVDEEIFVNEINAIPGSLAYYLFDHSLEEHLNILLKDALMQKQKMNNKCYSYDANILTLSAKK